jgi:hypothetical protein
MRFWQKIQAVSWQAGLDIFYNRDFFLTYLTSDPIRYCAKGVNTSTIGFSRSNKKENADGFYK